jgi:hypothetical protein
MDMLLNVIKHVCILLHTYKYRNMAHNIISAEWFLLFMVCFTILLVSDYMHCF